MTVSPGGAPVAPASGSTKVLVANRGEIAVRIIRACREMGLGVVAVYSDCDRRALHVRMADEACRLGPGPASESYLCIDRLVDAARSVGAGLVHPGYGFLAENGDFARACVAANLVFVGPPADVIDLMGGKTRARAAARDAGVPVVPGSDEPIAEDVPDDAVRRAADAVGYPLVVKAVAGGGGKGMRAVDTSQDLLAAVDRVRSEARSAFGDGRYYFERRLTDPRHVEIQLLADAYGLVVPFVERECSIQRRHQKVVEESPSAALTPETRRAMAEAAVRVARAAGYVNAGTVEFLVDGSGRFYFLEMNTRLQVEHPVTEAVTGIDLVQWQLRIARGEPLSIDPGRAIDPRGHAIECRIYAEDPDAGFLPSPGLVRALTVPGGPGVRDDRGVEAGDEIPIFYDPLIAKLTAWGSTRAEAIGRLTRALEEYRIVGVRTTLPFFRWLVTRPEFLDARVGTTYLDQELARRREPFQPPSETDISDAVMAVAASAWLRSGPAALPVSVPDSNWRRTGRTESQR